jgi:hypothetical protein
MVCPEEGTNPNFPERLAIKRCIEGLLPGPLVSHLSREPPTNLQELYAEMEKYARFDADYKRRAEMRKIMRQNFQPGWHNPNHYNPRPQNPQYILPVQPQQEDES